MDSGGRGGVVGAVGGRRVRCGHWEGKHENCRGGGCMGTVGGEGGIGTVRGREAWTL